MARNSEVFNLDEIKREDGETAGADLVLNNWLRRVLPDEMVGTEGDFDENKLLREFGEKASIYLLMRWSGVIPDDSVDVRRAPIGKMTRKLIPPLQFGYPRKVSLMAIWQALTKDRFRDEIELRRGGLGFDLYYKLRDAMRVVGDVWHNLGEAYDLLNERFVYEVRQIESKTKNPVMRHLIKFITGV